MMNPLINRSLALWIACILFTVLPVRAEDQTRAAVDAALAWLALVDAGEYASSWKEAAPIFKESVKEKPWSELIASVRDPLGKVKSRTLLGSQYTTTLPGAPSGEYVVIQFKTEFSEKPDSIETITPMMTADGWRVSGYYIK